MRTGVSSSVLQITVLPNCIKTVFFFPFASTYQWSQSIKLKPLFPLCNALPELASYECWLEGSLEVSRHCTAASTRSDLPQVCLATKYKSDSCVLAQHLEHWNPFLRWSSWRAQEDFFWGVHLPQHLSGKEGQKGQVNQHISSLLAGSCAEFTSQKNDMLGIRTVQDQVACLLGFSCQRPPILDGEQQKSTVEFTEELSQIPVCCQHKNSCHLQILRFFFVRVWIRFIFKTTFKQHKYTCH